MVQFTLPKNSKIRTGKTWPKPSGGNVRKFQIYRWSPDDDENPRVDTYFVDMDNCCLLYTSPSPRDGLLSRMPSSA